MRGRSPRLEIFAGCLVAVLAFDLVHPLFEPCDAVGADDHCLAEESSPGVPAEPVAGPALRDAAGAHRHEVACCGGGQCLCRGGALTPVAPATLPVAAPSAGPPAPVAQSLPAGSRTPVYRPPRA